MPPETGPSVDELLALDEPPERDGVLGDAVDSAPDPKAAALAIADTLVAAAAPDAGKSAGDTGPKSKKSKKKKEPDAGPDPAGVPATPARAPDPAPAPDPAKPKRAFTVEELAEKATALAGAKKELQALPHAPGSKEKREAARKKIKDYRDLSKELHGEELHVPGYLERGLAEKTLRDFLSDAQSALEKTDPAKEALAFYGRDVALLALAGLELSKSESIEDKNIGLLIEATTGPLLTRFREKHQEVSGEPLLVSYDHERVEEWIKTMRLMEEDERQKTKAQLEWLALERRGIEARDELSAAGEVDTYLESLPFPHPGGWESIRLLISYADRDEQDPFSSVVNRPLPLSFLENSGITLSHHIPLAYYKLLEVYLSLGLPLDPTNDKSPLVPLSSAQFQHELEKSPEQFTRFLDLTDPQIVKAWELLERDIKRGKFAERDGSWRKETNTYDEIVEQMFAALKEIDYDQFEKQKERLDWGLNRPSVKLLDAMVRYRYAPTQEAAMVVQDVIEHPVLNTLIHEGKIHWLKPRDKTTAKEFQARVDAYRERMRPAARVTDVDELSLDDTSSHEAVPVADNLVEMELDEAVEFPFLPEQTRNMLAGREPWSDIVHRAILWENGQMDEVGREIFITMLHDLGLIVFTLKMYNDAPKRSGFFSFIRKRETREDYDEKINRVLPHVEESARNRWLERELNQPANFSEAVALNAVLYLLTEDEQKRFQMQRELEEYLSQKDDPEYRTLLSELQQYEAQQAVATVSPSVDAAS